MRCIESEWREGIGQAFAKLAVEPLVNALCITTTAIREATSGVGYALSATTLLD